MKKNKVIILQHGGGELANQLWNYISIYAYSLERDFICDNPSFFEYGKYFEHRNTSSVFINILFFIPFLKHEKRRNSLFTKTFRFLYRIFVFILKVLHKKRVISTKVGTKEFVVYLPPTQENKQINQLERTGNIYLDGWMFRNPVGIKKYHKEIVSFFKPKTLIESRSKEIISKLRSNFKNVIGVHIRQGDYRTFKRGKYFVDQGRIREILDEFISVYKINKDQTVFFIASDGHIENNYFNGLSTYVSGENAAVDMFSLASTDVIIGSDSTFGDFAAYYGNIPHIVCSRDTIDWKYYIDKDGFFENKYSTMVSY